MTDAVQNPQQTGDQNAGETLILGKFKNVEALAQSYQELERKLGSRQQEPPKKQAVVDDLAIAPPTPATAEAVINEVYQKRASGQLSEADYAKLQNVGFTRSMAEEVFRGRDALAVATEKSVYDAAGGKQNFETMKEWAKANLTKAEADAFNNVMASRNPEAMALAVNGLKAKFMSANGNEPARLDGARPNTFSGVKPYADMQEYVKDTGNPQYRTDATFRNEAIKRFNASVQAGTIKLVG